MAGMEGEDSHLLLGNQESIIGVSRMISTIQTKTSVKNSILTAKPFKINKTDLKTALKVNFSQITQVQRANLKNHVDNLKTEQIKPAVSRKEWVTTSEPQYLKR